jgi:hypothetical protein
MYLILRQKKTVRLSKQAIYCIERQQVVIQARTVKITVNSVTVFLILKYAEF